jgi:hypothetical protein
MYERKTKGRMNKWMTGRQKKRIKSMTNQRGAFPSFIFIAHNE